MRSLSRITMKAALPGITTGMLVALAISVGETAPLLYTVGEYTSYGPTVHLTHMSVSYLTWVVYAYNQGTFPQALSYDAAFILMVIVLVLIIGSRLIVSMTQRNTERN